MKFLFTLFLFIIAPLILGQDTPSEEGPYRKTSTESHDMRVINSGLGSLYARIDMIRRAKKSIDLETYIFNPDASGKLVLHELAEAAKRGVKVRVLLDKAPGNFKLDEYYAKEMKEKGIEVRYYNPVSVLSLQEVQFRNHRKLMVRDGEEVITGGRNIADDYFDLDERFNFLDRDVTVEGEIVKTMDESFENFWNSRLSKEPKEVKEPEYRNQGEAGDEPYLQEKAEFDRRTALAKKLFQMDPRTLEKLKIVEEDGKESFLQHDKKKCPEISFASDKEGASLKESMNREEYLAKYRILRQEILKWLDTKTGDEFLLDTPYFLNSPLTERILAKLEAKKIKVKLFTNSLASTDAIPVSTAFNSNVTSFTAHDNFQAYVYRGKYSGEGKIRDDKVKNATWGTHSKSMVFSDKAFMIGSFNVDNRSSYFNTELAVFCNGSPELTAEIKENIQKRIDKSIKLDTEGNPINCDINAEAGPLKTLLYYVLKIPALMGQDLL